MFNDILLKDVVDSIGEGVFALDESCHITLWNKAMEEMTGRGAKEMMGKHCSTLVCSKKQSGSTNEKSLFPDCDCSLLALSGNAPVMRKVECVIKGHDGESIPVLKNTCLLTNKTNQPVGVVITLTDLRPIRRLQEDLAVMRHESTPVRGLGKLIGGSREMLELYDQIYMAGNSDVTVLIEGETGTGKELTAEAIHNLSARKNNPMIKVNCSALSENLLESELFGHVKGAFTGAIKDKIGRIEMAEGSTLFLDEIGEISPLIQLKLLRVLQEREYERVGESVTKKANIRIIAATNRTLKKQVASGEFRDDLFYRIRVFPIIVPPLRTHKKDIPDLCRGFMRKLNTHTGKSITDISHDALHCLMDYCWPGNIRELENVIEHAFVTCQNNMIELNDLPYELRTSAQRKVECHNRKNAGTPSDPVPSSVTRDILFDTLQSCRWNQSEAARRLGVDRTTVWRKMKQWDIKPPGQT
ncbi:MAG: sigma 54-interacting transcriptional regulator [Candidatus Aureabacteria bacterium]|nr:sigma 54-interacting transcriptional regulator [Candidatus Auribacterota bacterium]